MEIRLKAVKSILTPQKGGLLIACAYPFTHTLSAYVGCGFGQTTCGLYCYAPFLPNWSFSGLSEPWGKAILVKENAPEALEQTLSRMKPAARQQLRIFMSSTTDPYQPIEQRYQLTRRCLEVFSRYPDLDLLLIQTRSPLAGRDLDLMLKIPYAWLSVTIETDDQSYLKSLRGGPPLEKRWQLIRTASEAGLHAQIAVSPCLRYTSIEQFASRLLASGAQRLIVDSFTAGDGSGGRRTSASPFARIEPHWADTSHAQALYAYLREHAPAYNIAVGWSSQGFCSIPPRQHLGTR